MHSSYNQNQKTKQQSGHNRPKNMVWKIRRSSREKSADNHVAREPRANLRGALKHQEIDRQSQDSSSQTSSRRNRCDSSMGKDHSIRCSRSIGSRSTHSRNSGSSRGSRMEALEQHSLTSASSASSGILSKTSSARASNNSERSSRSQLEKVVRFGEIQIRDYERIVGDNPSCSAGPPIGIGWAHGGTRVVDISNDEHDRPYRKSHASMVLTREKREQILLSWGVSFHDIIESIRSNIKVKNQRRQTVTNLGKVERFEEAFESATRKLKRALLLKRRTGDKVKELQEQAELARNALGSLQIAEERALRQLHASSAPVEEEPDEDHLENIELQVSVSNLCRNPPMDSKLKRTTSNLSEDDLKSTLSGFSLGNSTSASVLEMEKFYRELELEMFGDMELPSMVGQTLEVPGVEIPEAERVYDDPPSINGFPVDDGSMPPPSAKYVNHSEMNIYIQAGPSARQDSQSSEQKEGHYPDQGYPPREELYRGRQFEGGPSPRHPYSQQAGPAYVIPDGVDYPNGYYPPSMTAISLDPTERGHQALQQIYALEQHYLRSHSSAPPPPPPPPPPSPLIGSTLSPRGYPTRSPPPPPPYGYHYHTEDRRRSTNIQYARRSNARDAPRVRHLPPPTHLTPTHWMEDSDTSRTRHGTYEPITITEEAYEIDNRYFMGDLVMSSVPNGMRSDEGPNVSQTAYGSYRPTSTPRYPSSFY